jgi:hypothetical protein
MNLRRRDKRADSYAAFYEAFAFERGQRVTRGHETDLMNSCQVALRRNRVTGMQVTGFYALPEATLDPPVSRHSILSSLSRLHALPRAWSDPIAGREPLEK